MDNILMDESAPETETIVEVLLPYYSLTSSGRILRTDAFDTLGTSQQLAAALLVLELQAEFVEAEWPGATVGDIGDAMGRSYNEYGFYATLRQYEQSGLVDRTSDGRYWVPDYRKRDVLSRVPDAESDA